MSYQPKKGSKKKAIKKAVYIIIVALILAALVTFGLMVSGVLDPIPEVEFPSIGVTLPVNWAVFVLLFLTFAAIGIVNTFLKRTIKKKSRDTRKKWKKVPDVVKAALVGLVFAIVAGASVGLTDYFLTEGEGLPNFLGFVVAGVVWVTIGFFSYRHLERERELAEWMMTLVLGTVVAGVLALVTVGIDRQIAPQSAYDLPNYAPLLVFLIGAAPAMYLIHGRDERGSVVSKLMVKTGMAQTGQLQTFTVAVAVGALAAVTVGFLVGISGVGFWITAFSFALVWVVTAAATVVWFGSSEAQTVLVIDNVLDRTSNQNRELSVRNLSDDPVDLRDARIRDTQNDLYRTNIQVVLGAGQTGKFDIPPGFSLKATEGGGDRFGIGNSSEVPVIVTPDGEKYELRWAHEVGDPHEEEEQPEETVRESEIDKIERKYGVDIDADGIERDKSKKRDRKRR